MEDKYKEAMVSSAQLYNEKTTLIFHVENLKDRSADHTHLLFNLFITGFTN